jgi:pimeloyl-ACP methyl ester carboxylesterase
MKTMLAIVMAVLISPSAGQASVVPESKARGSWLGTLEIGPTKLRVVFKVDVDSAGNLSAVLDSPDQGATGIPVSSVSLSGDSLFLAVMAIGGGFAGRIEPGDSTISGTWSQGGMALPLMLRRTLRPPVSARPQMPAPPFPYAAEEVSYESLSPGIRLAGTLTVPREGGPFPAVILITGSGPQDRDESLMGHKPFLVLSDYLSRRGVAVLRLDDRGIGGSTGSTMGATTKDFVQDVLAGVSYLKERREVNPARIGLAGHSEGGLVAPLAAGESKDVAFIVLLAAPGLPGEQILVRQTEDVLRSTGSTEAEIERARAANAKIYAAMREVKDSTLLAKKVRAVLMESAAGDSAGQDPMSSPAALEGQMSMLMSPWFRFFIGYDPRPALRSVACPVLALNGEKDIQVAAAENQAEIVKALREGGNTQVTARILPGLNHLFQTAQSGAIAEYGTIEETMAPAALEAIGAWIAGLQAK